MASFNITIPTAYPHVKALEIVASFNKIEVTFTESAEVVLPTLVLSDKEKTEVYGLVPIAYALARNSKNAEKKWAQTVLGDGIASKSAEIQQFASIANTIFTGKGTADAKFVIGQLQSHLKTRTLITPGLNLTLADVVLYLALYPAAQALGNDEREKDFADFIRWITFINESLGNPLPALPLPAHPYRSAGPSKGQKQQNQQNHNQQQQQGRQNQQQQQGGKKAAKPKAAPKPKQQPEEDKRDPFSWVDVRVGKIVKVWPHPNADTLYCEEIDIGNGVIKKVVTGVRNYVPIEQMQDRHVVVFTNIKPSKIRGMPSESMVFAGSNADHTVVELLDPPADAPIGTRVVCGDFVQGEVPGVDKKGKYWEAVTANNSLTINGDHLACYKGVPLSCQYGEIRVKSLTNCEFH